MNHDERVESIVSSFSGTGMLKSRESNTVEFKEAFNKGNTAKYAKTMAAFSNNRGGYIIFGVKDNPRTVVGLSNSNFDNLSRNKHRSTNRRKWITRKSTEMQKSKQK